MAVHEKHSTNQHQKQYKHLTVFERGRSKHSVMQGGRSELSPVVSTVHPAPSAAN